MNQREVLNEIAGYRNVYIHFRPNVSKTVSIHCIGEEKLPFKRISIPLHFLRTLMQRNKVERIFYGVYTKAESYRYSDK